MAIIDESTIDLLLSLADQQANQAVRTDAGTIIDILLNVPETIIISEAITITLNPAATIKWGAVGGPGNTKWGFFTWG